MLRDSDVSPPVRHKIVESWPWLSEKTSWVRSESHATPISDAVSPSPRHLRKISDCTRAHLYASTCSLVCAARLVRLFARVTQSRLGCCSRRFSLDSLHTPCLVAILAHAPRS